MSFYGAIYVPYFLYRLDLLQIDDLPNVGSLLIVLIQL